MSIIDRIKRRLPIVGPGGNAANPESVVPDSVTPQPAAPSPQTAPPVMVAAEEKSAARGTDVRSFIDELVKSNLIVLFMKGSPASPMCGFSANAAGVLQQYGHPLAHFDVLSDPEVRQGVKEYSQWPTIPQVYVGGEFLGGSDILMQMHDAGELKEAIEKAAASSE